ARLSLLLFSSLLPTFISSLSLHDALPIFSSSQRMRNFLENSVQWLNSVIVKKQYLLPFIYMKHEQKLVLNLMILLEQLHEGKRLFFMMGKNAYVAERLILHTVKIKNYNIFNLNEF